MQTSKNYDLSQNFMQKIIIGVLTLQGLPADPIRFFMTNNPSFILEFEVEHLIYLKELLLRCVVDKYLFYFMAFMYIAP